MTDKTDWQLLQEYARAGGTDAFEELVCRHLDMVYGLARRQAPQAAEDVVQAVFLLLAQKGRTISAKSSVAGWLHRATRFCCANVKKMENRRKHYERKAALMTTEADKSWDELLPLLDDAVDSLGQTERDAVLLRYMQARSIEQTSQELSISTDAAAKRAGRGLEKLRKFFDQHGYTVPLLAVVALITAENGKAAPISASSLAQTVLSAGISTTSPISNALLKGAETMIVLSKIKSAGLIAAICLLLFVLAAGVVQEFVIQKIPQSSQSPSSPPTTQNVPEAVQSFLRDYPLAAMKLEEAYSHVRIVAKQLRTDSEGRFLWNEQTEFLREGNLVLIDRTVLDSVDPRWTAGARCVEGGNAEKFFGMTKVPGEIDFKIDTYGPDRSFEQFVALKWQPVYGAFCTLEQRITDQLKQSNFRVVSCTSNKLDGQEVIEVIGELTLPKITDLKRLALGIPADAGISRRHFVFQPGSWALISWTLFSGNKMPSKFEQRFQGRITYEPDSDPPKMKSIDTWMEVRGNREFKLQQRRDEISLVDFSPIDAKQFSLDKFGVREPDQIIKP